MGGERLLQIGGARRRDDLVAYALDSRRTESVPSPSRREGRFEGCLSIDPVPVKVFDGT